MGESDGGYEAVFIGNVTRAPEKSEARDFYAALAWEFHNPKEQNELYGLFLFERLHERFPEKLTGSTTRTNCIYLEGRKKPQSLVAQTGVEISGSMDIRVKYFPRKNQRIVALSGDLSGDEADFIMEEVRFLNSLQPDENKHYKVTGRMLFQQTVAA